MTKSSKICLWYSRILITSKMCYKTLHHLITCQSNFLSDCDFTIVFKNNGGENSLHFDLILKIHHQWRLSYQHLHMTEIYLGSQQHFRSSDLLCQISSSLTSFSMTISFFSSPINSLIFVSRCLFTPAPYGALAEREQRQFLSWLSFIVIMFYTMKFKLCW